MSSGTYRVALFGAGTRGTILADHLATHPDVTIGAVVDVDAGRARALADRLGGSVHTDYREALSDGGAFDLVVVATMPVLHREQCVAALEAGANVLCEKPFAVNAAEAREMVEAARKASRFLTVGCNMRHMGSAQYLKGVIDAGTIGAVAYTHAQAFQPAVPWFGPHYVKRLAGGGVGYADAVHVLDLSLGVSGQGWPTTVSASSTRLFPHKRAATAPSDEARRVYDVEDLMTAHIRFDDGTWMTLELAWCWDLVGGTLSFVTVGNQGTVQFSPLSVMAEEDGELGDRTAADQADTDWDRSTATEITDVMTALRGGAAPTITPEESYKVQVIVDALYRSAESGREVAITDPRL